MGLIIGTILIGIGAMIGWAVKGKVNEKEDTFRPQKEDY